MKTNALSFLPATVVFALGILPIGILSARAAVIADSITEFSGVQGQNGWFNGYRNYTQTGETENYDPQTDFTPYEGGEGQGPWDGFAQFWTGAAWDLNTAGAGPWTFQNAQSIHPNGINSAPNEEHWAIRRWVASELSAETSLQIVWIVRKENTAGGNGVTGGIWFNGKKLAAVSIAGNNGAGVTRTNYVSVKPADRIDLALSPLGPDGQRGDGADGSITSMIIETVTDTDADKLPDAWENIYSPGDLTKLNGTGDFDRDALTDLAEMNLNTDPTKADTDGDGLTDAVETNTGMFVSATNTGTDPLRKDTDGDNRNDGDEVKGSPTSNPFLPDTDEDTFLDGLEAASGHNPADPNDNPSASAIARSADDFSGIQGEKNWFYGYRNFTADGGGNDYHPQSSFIAFTEDQFTGGLWDLNTAPTAPWTELGREATHPNGSNNGPVHWTVRRWVASDLTKATPLALHWHTRKTNLGGGNGVTGSLHLNGKEVDKVTIAFNNGTGFFRTYYANVSPGDIIDIVHRPTGTDGTDADGADGSGNILLVDPVLPPTAFQPDGTLFIPVGAGDTDADGIPDAWENLFFPNDLTKLSRTGDNDADGLTDLLEYQRDSNPTLADTDGDGLLDLVETGTGQFVSATDTGSSPKNADTDGDRLSDRDEVQGTPATNPNKADSDGDGFSDPDEIAAGTDPNNRADHVLAFVIANSIAEFSGVQGSNSWFNGYRNYTQTGETQDYNAQTDFILYPGGAGQGPWDGETQMWTGSSWDLNTAGAGPWTFQAAEATHPNGVNSTPNEEHWTIRRWLASEVAKVTPAAIIWRVRKENPAGDGVTGAVHLNGKLLDSVTIAGNNSTNAIRRYYVNLNPGDIVDLALTPEGLTTRSDGADGSFTWFWVDTRIPANPRQPDGTRFDPAGQGVRLEPSLDLAQNRITFAWNSSADARYTIEVSEDLKTWTVVRADLPSAGNRTTFSETIDPAKRARFYRIKQ